MSQKRLLCLGFTLVIILSSCRPAPIPAVSPAPTLPATQAPIQSPTQELAAPTEVVTVPTSTPVPVVQVDVPYDQVSLESMLADLEVLTTIQPYSGWRSGGTVGEVEAFQYVESRLQGLTYLNEAGLEIEHQEFPLYLAVEFWEARLHLTQNGQEIEVPAEALRGSRYQASLARYFDSDGGLNDDQRDPVEVSGAPLLVRDVEQFYALQTDQVRGRVLFMDYYLIDCAVNSECMDNTGQLQTVFSYVPAGLLLVTQYSNVDGESRGMGLGDGSVFQRIPFEPKVPILHIKVEDLSAAGISSWDDLVPALEGDIQSARLTWDADVFSPGWSQNLIARIPGADSSAAVILGAHVDSPNSPGAFDDGSGVVTLLEVARVLNESHIQPPVDLYLAWFGSHELGIYGSAHFVATHQELLDHTLAMLQIDCLGYPMEGHNPSITLDTWTYGQFVGVGGNDRPLWPDYLIQTVVPHGVVAESYIEYGLSSDNSNFMAFDVPNTNLIYINMPAYARRGSSYLHYAVHLHDPYETVDLVRDVGEVLVDMTRIALAAGLQTGYDRPDLRAAPAPERRALLVASHTQTPDLAPVAMAELGMALAWQGFDVDLLPFGQPVTAQDLQNTDIVVLLPSMDYPTQEGGDWSPQEIDALDAYIQEGGFLVVTNSYHNIAMTLTIEDVNEDAFKINDLTERFGVSFIFGSASADVVLANKDAHPLMENASYLEMMAAYYNDNGVPFKIDAGKAQSSGTSCSAIVLAMAGSRAVLALVDYGQSGGQVLVVADIGLLSDYGRGGKNLTFLQNLAKYVAQR
ncbi:MAG: M28 family peptidase [Chloroflexota bacterium]